MKIFNILAIAVVFTASILPSVQAASYGCEVDAFYKIVDDDTNPTIPNSSEKSWAKNRVKASYNEIHQDYNNDFDMDSISLTSFSLSEARRIGSLNGALMGYLRGGVTGTTVYDGKLYNDAGVGCNLCINWDDDDPPVDAQQEMIDNMIRATINHGRWEDDWCNELDLGPYQVFNGVYDCTITLHNCATRRSEDAASAGKPIIRIDIPDEVEDAIGEIVEEGLAKTLSMDNHGQKKALV